MLSKQSFRHMVSFIFGNMSDYPGYSNLRITRLIFCKKISYIESQNKRIYNIEKKENQQWNFLSTPLNSYECCNLFLCSHTKKGGL